ncbi:MAG: dihydrodipicolinate synthase family protein [Acidimicrobiia bacterium]
MRTPPRVMPALITPFTRSGDLDLEAHRHNLETLAGHRITGFLIGGSTGEGPYLEPGERTALIWASREAVGRRPFLLAGVTAETQRAAEAQVREASEAGADGVLVLTPTTLARNRHALVRRHFEELADASPLPVLLYSVPTYTAYPLPEEVVAELAEHPNIVGMKDSGGDPVRMQRLVAATPEGFILFAGSSQAVTLSLAAGAYGAITASVNYVPDLLGETVATARRSPTSAAPLQRRLSRISAVVEPHGVPGVKAAAAAVGLRPGHPRLPLRRLPARLAERLAREAADA